MQQLKDGIADAVAKDGKVTLMVDHFQRQTDHGTPVPTDGDGSNAADDLTQYMPSYLQEPQTQVQEAVAVPEEHNGTDSEADDRAGDGSGSGTPWLHESLSTPEADALLVGDGDAQDGTFIVRVRRKQTLPTYTCVYHSCRHMLATGRCGVPWVWWLLVWCTLGLVGVGVVYLGVGGCWCVCGGQGSHRMMVLLWACTTLQNAKSKSGEPVTVLSVVYKGTCCSCPSGYIH